MSFVAPADDPTVTWFAFLTHDAPAGACCEIRPLPPSPMAPRTWLPADDPLRVARAFLALDGNLGGSANNTFAGVHLRRARGEAGDASVPQMTCIPVDIDCGAGKAHVDKTSALAAIHSLTDRTGLSPGLVLDSGHGLWAIYGLTSGLIDQSRYRMLAGRLVAALHGDAACINPERICRAPGGVNRKGPGTRPVVLLEHDLCRYDVETFEERLPPANGTGHSTCALPAVPNASPSILNASPQAPQATNTIPQGARHRTLLSLAGTMRRRGMSAEAILVALRVDNAERCLPPCDDAELVRLATSVAHYAPARPADDVSMPETSVRPFADASVPDGPEQPPDDTSTSDTSARPPDDASMPDPPVWLHSTPTDPTSGPDPSPSLAEDGRPVIQITTDMPSVVAAAVAAICIDPLLYQRDGRIVRVVHDYAPPIVGLRIPPDTAVIASVPDPVLRLRLSSIASWCRYDGRSKSMTRALPPDWAVSAVQTLGEWSLRRLTHIVDCPAFRPDGSILDVSGYDAATGLLFEPPADAVCPAIAAFPTGCAVRDARELLHEPLADFAFVADSDRSAALAAMFAGVARHAIDGCVPWSVVSAPVAASGKSLLADIVAIIATGRDAPRLPQGRDADEDAKRILALLLAGLPVVLIDNCAFPLGNATLDALATARVFEGRVLGESRVVRVHNNTFWLATGNNLTYAGDFARRVLPIRLDPKQEDPEQRVDFRIADVRSWVLAHRFQLVAAVLTILRAWHVAGRPIAPTIPQVGSFEQWRAMIPAALVWLGEESPLAHRRETLASADIGRQDLGAFLTTWHAACGSGWTRTRDVVARAGLSDLLAKDLHESLCSIDPRGEGSNLKSIGKFLARHKGRIIAGLCIQATDRGPRSPRDWRVVEAAPVA